MSVKNADLPGEEDDRATIELEIVRGEESHPGGRPLFLTPKRFIRICHWIERGESASESCRRELVTYQGFRRHVIRNPKYQRRLKEAEELREHFLREFHIANITKHAEKNVAASMFWLERRYPAEFALKNVVRVDPDGDKEVQEETPAEVLARHRALLLELAREDEAKRANLTQDESAAGPVDSVA